MLRFFIAFMLCSAAAYAQTSLYAKSYYIFHPASGTVVLEKAAEEKVGPASLTKLMTLYLTFQALKAGELSLQSQLLVSEKAWKKGGSKMFVEVGKKVAVEDLIQGVAVSSGNDATIVLAEFLGGTEEGFAEMMNATAKKLGMENTHFMNASGWPHPNQYTTAKDIALLAHKIHENFPEYYPVFTQQSFEFSGIKQRNRNGLLSQGVGVDGLKTGHTEEAGYHLVSSAQRGETRLFAAVLGTNSMKEREAESLKGLNYAFRAYKSVWPVREGEVVVEAAPVRLGSQETVPIIAGESLSLYLPKSEDVISEVEITQPLTAPLKAGQQVGTISITASGKTHQIPAQIGQDVAALSFLESIGWRIKNFMK